MELELKLKVGTLIVKQFEVITGKVIDQTEKVLSDYINAVVMDANAMSEFTGYAELLAKINSGEKANEQELLGIQLQVLKSEIIPTSTKAGREAMYNLAIASVDQSQMTTDEKKQLKDYSNWENQDISKVGEFVNYFRQRLRGRS